MRSSVAAMAWAVLVLIACVGRSPEARHFALASEMPPRGAEQTDVAVTVLRPTLPRHVDRGEMVRLGRDGEILADEGKRWAGGLASNVARALADGLAARLGSDRVALAPEGAEGGIELAVAFRELIADSDRVRLRARYRIRSADGAVEAGHLSADRALADGSPAALVRGHDAVLAELTDAIAERIRALAARPPASPAEPGGGSTPEDSPPSAGE